MEYGTGTELVKIQWDATRAPGHVIGLFQKDKSGMSAENNYIVIEQDGVFFTPAGNPFLLKTGSKIYAACMDYKQFPSWAVYVFESNGKKYNTNYKNNLSAGFDFDCYYQVDNPDDKYSLPAEVKGKATFIQFGKVTDTDVRIVLMQESRERIHKNTGNASISFAEKPQTDALVEVDRSNNMSVSSPLCQALLNEAEQQANNDKKSFIIKDKSNKLSVGQKKYLEEILESAKAQTEVSWRIIITGNNSDKRAAEEEGTESKQPILHLHFEENGEINGNIYGGDKIGYIPINNDFIQKLITPLRPFEGAVGKMLEGLSFLIGKVIIPDKYYNSKSKDGYDDILASTYSVANGNYGKAQIEIAFTCGLWNGLLGTMQALPDGANLVDNCVVLCMDAIFDKGTARQDIKNFRDADKWEKIKEVADLFYQNVKEETDGNPPMVSYYSGRMIFEVATVYISVAKVGKFTSVINAIEKLDIFAQTLGKVMKATGVVIRQSSRFINASLQSGYTFMRMSARSGNLYCGIPIPIGEGGTKAYKEVVEKFKEKWNKGVINAEEIIVKADDAGNPLLDEKGRKVGYYEQDGEKIFVLLDASAENLPEGVVDNFGEAIADVAKATEKQLDDVFERLIKETPFEYIPNTLEHKAQRWSQYKASGGKWNYERWSNTYNVNMEKARLANKKVSAYYDEINFNCTSGNCKEVTLDVIVDGQARKRRLDIADGNPKVLHGIEVKAYETGKVYATKDILEEIAADAQLIKNSNWKIDWVFVDCDISQPLREALEAVDINIIFKKI
jgi:hypothetical protein